MELQQLKYFKMVAEIGKISDAAEALFISAPALSTSISRLEKELGVRLFDRTNNRILLNQQGQIFLRYVNQIFSSLENAKSELRQSMQQQGPHISIVSVNSAMWANLITAFTSEYPQFTLSCSSATISGLAENGLPVQHNFLLASETDLPAAYAEELDSVFLLETAPMVMVHPDHPLARQTVVDVSMLANENIFMPVTNGSLHERISRLFDMGNIAIPTDNSYSFLARQMMVSQNLGVSFITEYARSTVMYDLRFVPLADPFGPWVNRLYWRKNHALTEDEQVFRTFAETFFHSLH